MATDPERLQRVADEAERHTRTWRESPEESFGQVMGRAPAKGELDDTPPPKAPKGDADGGGDNSDAENAGAVASSAKPPKTPAKVSLRAPDPRARLLHAALDRKGPVPSTAKPTDTPAPMTDTPATGTAGLKPASRPQ